MVQQQLEQRVLGPSHQLTVLTPLLNCFIILVIGLSQQSGYGTCSE